MALRAYLQRYGGVVLLLFALGARILYLFPDTVPFSFDHGKDSVAILHMVKTFSPKFIGPWTSIPGLFFGPAWYYLLAPAYFLSGGNPVSAALTMTLMVVAEVWIAYRYFGKYEAMIITSAPGWLIISKSAWNPFPMTFLMLVVLIILKNMKKVKEKKASTFFILFFLISLGFHFSAAFAALWLVALLIVLGYRRVVVSLRSLISALLGFAVPFIPQLLFEVKNGFVQTKAVVAYFSGGEPQQFGVQKVLNVVSTTLGELKLAVLPEVQQPFLVSGTVVTAVGFILLLAGWLYPVMNKKRFPLWFESLAFMLIPLLGFSFLHFNYWYITALMPVAVIYVGHILRHSPRMIVLPYLALLLVTPVFAYVRYFTVDRMHAEESREMLPAKLRALDYIYKESEGKPFSSYHYVPDIYDYSYQYLYMWQAFRGKPLPEEFSYQPGEVSYIPEKQDVLDALGKAEGKFPEKVFYIVEKPQNEDYLDAWWGRQRYGTMVGSVAVSPEITVYAATPPEQ